MLAYEALCRYSAFKKHTVTQPNPTNQIKLRLKSSPIWAGLWMEVCLWRVSKMRLVIQGLYFSLNVCRRLIAHTHKLSTVVINKYEEMLCDAPKGPLKNCKWVYIR